MTVDKKELRKHTEITDVDFSIEGSHLAVCHEAQGYSANGYHEPLAMKAAFNTDKVNSLDLMKALEQVTITISFEEMLQRFFGMWSRDAAVLAKLLGFETEMEAELGDEKEPDEWELQYLAGCLEDIEDQAEKFDIIKKAANNNIDELTLEQRKSLYGLHTKIQNIVENDLFTKAAVGSKAKDYAYVPDKETPSSWKLNISDAVHTRAAVAALGKGFRGNKVSIPEADRSAVKSKVRAAYKKFFPNNEVPEVIQASTEPLKEGITEPSIKSTITKNNKEDLVTKEVIDNAVTDQKDEVAVKAVTPAEYEMLSKALEDIKAQNAELIKANKKAEEEKQALLKAQEQERFEKAVAEKADFIMKMNFSDFDEEKQVLLATSLVKAENADVIVKAMQELFDRAEKAKENFAPEVGKDGKVEVAEKGDTALDLNALMMERFQKAKQNK